MQKPMLALIPGALLSQKVYHLFSSICFAFFSFIKQNFRYVAVFRSVEIIKREGALCHH